MRDTTKQSPENNKPAKREHSSAGRASALQAEGHRFEPHSGRHCFASVAQSVEQRTENPRVDGSIPSGSTKCGFSSSGRAPPCQGGGSEFEPRNPLQKSPYDE